MSEADALNSGCFCTTLDRRLLAEALDRQVGLDGLAEQLGTTHPTLFSNVRVFQSARPDQPRSCRQPSSPL